MHTEIIPLIKNGFFFDLASHLYNDCCDIPRLIPADEQKLIGLLKHLIESISDLWFDRDEADPDTYQMWTPTKELQDRHKQLRGNISAESAVHQKAMNAEIAQKVSKRLRLSQEFGLLPGEKKVKRVASSPLEAELVPCWVDGRDADGCCSHKGLSEGRMELATWLWVCFLFIAC